MLPHSVIKLGGHPFFVKCLLKKRIRIVKHTIIITIIIYIIQHTHNWEDIGSKEEVHLVRGNKDQIRDKFVHIR